jgi:hypothetical protein
MFYSPVWPRSHYFMPSQFAIQSPTNTVNTARDQLVKRQRSWLEMRPKGR